MSSSARKIISTQCRYCGNPVYYFEVRNFWQRVHTECVRNEPFDFVYNFNNFTLKLHSELVNPKQLSTIIKKLPIKEDI